jgi:hypothetical protein
MGAMETKDREMMINNGAVRSRFRSFDDMRSAVLLICMYVRYRILPQRAGRHALYEFKVHDGCPR